MGSFTQPLDIWNRALQHLGQTRIAAVTEVSKNNSTIQACYEHLREAELRRNVWRFAIRENFLRGVQDTQGTVGTVTLYPTMVLVPEAWSVTATYVTGAIVLYTDGYFYQALAPIVAGVTPGPGSPWAEYFGNMTVTPYDTTGSTAYYAGEIVYTPVGVNPGIYMSLLNLNGNTANNPAATAPTVTPLWSASIAYNVGETVTYLSVIYQSTEDLNFNQTPTGTGPWIAVPGTQPDVMQGQNWLKLGSTVKSLKLVYPAGAGPMSQSSTQNIFQLPNGFLRKAPTNPKLGNMSYLGRPSNPLVDDWLFEGNFLISGFAAPLYLRSVCDWRDVSTMDPMFCEGLAARIAFETCEALTQSDAKMQLIAKDYTNFMNEAREVNGIETGAEEPPLDDYLACRL